LVFVELNDLALQVWQAPFPGRGFCLGLPAFPVQVFIEALHFLKLFDAEKSLLIAFTYH
jgi:hypothetical protein